MYAPRVLAGIAGLKDTLEDRSLPLFMLRKRRSDPVARLGRTTEAEAQALRQACGLACLTQIERVVSAYDGAPVLLEREGIDDRAVDIWSPLIAVTSVADLEDHGTRTRELLDAARELSRAREADADAGTTARLVEALDTIRVGYGETITPADLLEALRARSGWDWLKSGRRLAGLLNPPGITRRQLWNGGRRRWCYVLDAGQLGDLRARYGAGDEEAPEGPDAAPASLPALEEPVQSGDW